MRVFAHQAARRGSQQFQFPVPQPPIGGNTLGGKTVAATDAGATVVGLAGTGAPVIDAGRFIKFANHAKVYIVEASGSGSLTIFPGLVSAVLGGVGVSFLPDLTCKYAGLARMAFRRGRATPALIVEEVI